VKQQDGHADRPRRWGIARGEIGGAAPANGSGRRGRRRPESAAGGSVDRRVES
jgi:hypothetical protein